MSKTYWFVEPLLVLSLKQNPLEERQSLRYIHWRGNGTPLQYSCLENPMHGEAWWAAVHGVAKSHTWLSDFPFTFHFSLSCIGEGNGNHSSVLACRIPGTGEPGGLPSMGSHRVGHDWSDLAAAAGYIHSSLTKFKKNIPIKNALVSSRFEKN